MTVLAPIDGSDCSVRGLEFAREFADRFDASLHVVHFSDAETDAAREVCDRARAALAEAGVDPAGGDTDTDVEVVVRDIEPATAARVGKAVLAYAEREGMDHVVMGHHGAGRVERAILGSAAETVVRGETVPVTVIP
jgi:nucleotide-binding universal stress UspA family protein